MVGEGEGVGDDLPGFLPAHAVLVHQQAHELRDGQHRVGIVQLHGVVFREVLQITVVGQVAADHRL